MALPDRSTSVTLKEVITQRSKNDGDDVPHSPSVPKKTEKKQDKCELLRSIPNGSNSQMEGSEDDGDKSIYGSENDVMLAAGRINKKGAVVDDEGNVIGRVIDGDIDEFVGFIATQEGDVLNHQGDIVGKAEPFEDMAIEFGYHTFTSQATTHDAHDLVKKQQELGGFAKASNSVKRTLSVVTGALGDTTKGVIDITGSAIGTLGLFHQASTGVKGTEQKVGARLPHIHELSTSAAGSFAAMFEGPSGVASDGQVKGRKPGVFDRFAADSKTQCLIGKDTKGIDEFTCVDERLNAIEEAMALPGGKGNIAQPFKDYPDAAVGKDGYVITGGHLVIGVVGGDWQNLAGKRVDADGDIFDKNGKFIGQAKRQGT